MNKIKKSLRRLSPARTLRRPRQVESLEIRRLLDGLTGQYFNSLDHTEPVLTRLDPTIDFTWPGAPATGVNADFFSARWTGQVQAASTEVYTFTTTADDGVRLWVDGRLIIDNWVNQGTTDRTGTVALEANKLYDVRLDYYEYDLGARLRLAWSTPTIAKQTVPASRLFAAPAGLAATYFDNTDFTKPVLARTDANVDFSWPTGTPDPAAVVANGFSARWTGYVAPLFTENYTFSIAAGETTNVRLRVDGKLLVDFTSDQDDGRLFMEAGKRYAITLEMADAGGPANITLNWQSPTTALQAIPTTRFFAGAQTGIPSRRATYTNPVIDADMPDPGVIFADGSYWMVHTMGGPDIGWPLWKSSDMVNWTFVKQLLTTANKPSWMSRDFWAPEIHKVGNSFVITGTATDSRINRLTIAMGSSDRVDGSYVVRSEPIVSASVSVLDSDIFQDDNGRQYLLWKRDSATSGGTHGSIRIRELDATGLNFKIGSSETVILDNETDGWERFLAEAPWLVKRNDAYYLFYSGAFIDTSYSVGVARSTSLTTMFARNPANPIISNNGTWGGPGHGGFAADRDGNLWHLYHARQQSNQNAGRKQVLDPVVWTASGWPSFANNSVSDVARAGPHVDAASGAGVLSLAGDLANAGQADLFRVVRGADASTIEVYLNGALVKSAPFTEVQQIGLDAKAGADVLVLDFSRGDVMPGNGISFDGGTGSDVVRVIAGPNGLPYRHFASGKFAFGSGIFSSVNVEKLALVNGEQRVTADLNGVALDVLGGTITFDVSQKLGAVGLTNNTFATLVAGDRSLVVTSLQIATGSSLDLTDGLLVVDYAGASPIAAVETSLQNGYAGGAWNGATGIVSSTAATTANTLGIAEASDVLATTPAIFGGVNVDGTSVLVRYSLPGDTNLDRVVGFDDLLALAQTYGNAGGWRQGDADFDGQITFDDLLALAQNYGGTIVAAAGAGALVARTPAHARRQVLQ